MKHAERAMVQLRSQERAFGLVPAAWLDRALRNEASGRGGDEREWEAKWRSWFHEAPNGLDDGTHWLELRDRAWPEVVRSAYWKALGDVMKGPTFERVAVATQQAVLWRVLDEMTDERKHGSFGPWTHQRAAFTQMLIRWRATGFPDLLPHALRKNKVEVARSLLGFGADLNAPVNDGSGFTCLQFVVAHALRWGKPSLPLKGNVRTNWAVRSPSGGTLIHLAFDGLDLSDAWAMPGCQGRYDDEVWRGHWESFSSLLQQLLARVPAEIWGWVDEAGRTPYRALQEALERWRSPNPRTSHEEYLRSPIVAEALVMGRARDTEVQLGSVVAPAPDSVTPRPRRRM